MARLISKTYGDGRDPNIRQPSPALSSASGAGLVADDTLNLINSSRIERSLRPLIADSRLVVVAQAFAEDLVARSFFDHVSPDGKGLVDRMAAHSVAFRSAGENLAHAGNAREAHVGLMNSPGHRANILGDFDHVGIGVAMADSDQVVIVQVFALGLALGLGSG